MANKPAVLVNLNVILDVVQHRQPFYKESARVLDTVVQGKVTGLIAAHCITTLHYVITRFRNRETAATATTALLEVFTVATVDDAVIRKALSWGWSDFEDAVQMAAAVNADVAYLITRNPRDFKKGLVPVVQPAAFLTLITS